jgi:hypothetical protein
MAHEYLFKEYEFCFEQLRFYDTRHESLLKYTFSLTSAVATAQFAVYQLLHGATVAFFGCGAILFGLVFIATVLLFLAMLQNRLYFVYVARQINAIRGYLMEVAAEGFKKNQMYTSTDFPALKILSLQTLQIFGTALISSGFAGASAFAIRPALGSEPSGAIGVWTCVLVLIAEVSSAIAYLELSGRKSADKAIHGRSRGKTSLDQTVHTPST